MNPGSSNLETAKRYLAFLEQKNSAIVLTDFFTPDVVQVEFPNRLTPHGATRDLAAMVVGHERGKSLMSAQRYEVVNSLSLGEIVVLEVLWTGTLAVAAGTLAAGDQMKAHFAVFLEFRDGKIAAQRNYDCFEPW